MVAINILSTIGSTKKLTKTWGHKPTLLVTV